MPIPPDLQRPEWLEWLRRHIWVLVFTAGALTLTGLRCSGRLRYVPDPPAVMLTLPDAYALVDHQGRPFGPETLRGKVWVAGFVFTSCPSSCPAVTTAMAQLRERFDRNHIDVEMVSFTVDPQHDTPAVLASYLVQQGVASDRWRFVTGQPSDPTAVLRLVRHGFKLGVGDREADTKGVAYDIAHSTKLALVDGQGGVRGFYDISDEHGTDEIFERATHVLDEMERAR
jgi:protein SCO1